MFDARTPLMISPLAGICATTSTRARAFAVALAALPRVIDAPVSMGEGCTPMAERAWRSAPAFPLEWFNPTCSFAIAARR